MKLCSSEQELEKLYYLFVGECPGAIVLSQEDMADETTGNLILYKQERFLDNALLKVDLNINQTEKVH